MSIGRGRRLAPSLLNSILALVAVFCLATSARATDLPALEENAMRAAAARVAPSVVRIETVGGAETVGEGDRALLVGPGATTGLVVSEDGYIVSSAFNFAQKPDSILVTLAEGRRVAAKLVATDHSRQLVLLKVTVDAKLPVPEAAPRREIRVGQWAIALGRTYESAHPNLSIGVISAVDRVWSKAIQTDAKISPSNYGGPLVDIAGRVLGVLAPLTPESSSEFAGVDWYDSGIGFAVPLEDIERALPRLKLGEDLKQGLMGISVQGADLFSTPPVIAACRALSPAHKAGFKAADIVVEIAGKKITRQAELKHQLGPRYAGEKVAVVVDRAGERIEREIELVDKLEPFDAPFLGFLPMRPFDDSAGLVVRYVYPESPAAKSGLAPGDRITKFDGAKIENAQELSKALASLAPGTQVAIEALRGSETQKLTATLDRLPEKPPSELPPAHPAPPAVEADQPPTGVVPVKVLEVSNECSAYVPPNYRPSTPFGVVIWLHAPGAMNQDAIINDWKPLCDKHDLILLAPKAADPKQWRPTETRFIGRALLTLTKTYKVDMSRIVVHGYEGGGAMAYQVALSAPGLVQGVAAVEAPLPITAKPMESDPSAPIAFYVTLASKTPLAPRIEGTIAKLRSLKYPVTVKPIGEQARYLLPDERAELARWIDSLDRL